MSELVIFHKGKRILNYPLNKSLIQIGRSQDCDLILTGDQVSRVHALIKKEDHDFWLEDKSSLGTFLNKNKISNKTKLKIADKIQIMDWELSLQKDSELAIAADQTRKTEIQELTQSLLHQTDLNPISFSDTGQTVTKFFPLLLITQPDGKTSRVIMKKKKLIVGKSENCDLQLSDSFVSSQHLSITSTDRGFLVADLESTNGTWVGDAKIKEIYLKDGEKIKIGKTQILVSLKKNEKEKIVPYAKDTFCGMVGSTKEMKYLFSKIQKVAATDMTTLILGETGTGKEMIATAVHDLSERREKPYVAINCGAMTPQLIESELFGHEKGAFTGAEKQHKGVFEQADGGVLFLDEIGELSLDLQTKVLRVLEYKTLRRVGGDSEIKIDVRVVAATHRDLAKKVKDGSFREDLFYRLYVLPLKVPPLRERKQDISLLVQSFITSLTSDNLSIDPEALDQLQQHDWPGNVRELKNTLMRAVAFCEDHTITKQDIEIIRVNPAKVERAVPEDEIVRIQEALKKAGGDKNEAAKILGMGRSTLFRKIKQLEIEI